MVFFVVPFMFFWNLYGNFMIKQEMFKVEGPYSSSGSGKQPMIADPCADGSCIPNTIINGTIANHTVTIKEDEHGKVVITCEDDEGRSCSDNDKAGPLPIHIKEITRDDDNGYPNLNKTMPGLYHN